MGAQSVVESHPGLFATSDQCSFLLEAALADYDPDTTVVLLVLGANDLSDHVPPNEIRTAVQQLKEMACQRGFRCELIYPWHSGARPGHEMSHLRKTSDGTHYDTRGLTQIRTELKQLFIQMVQIGQIGQTGQMGDSVQLPSDPAIRDSVTQ